MDWWDRSIPHRDGLRAYHVAVEITSPGSRIEVNGEHVATIAGTTGEVMLWADANGTFRNNQLVSIVANPTKVGEFRQTKVFAGALQRTYVPRKLYFDLRLEPTKPKDRIDVNVNER